MKIAVLMWDPKKSFQRIGDLINEGLNKYGKEFSITRFVVAGALTDEDINDQIEEKWNELYGDVFTKRGEYLAIIACGEIIHNWLNELFKDDEELTKFKNLNIPLVCTVGGSNHWFRDSNVFGFWGPDVAEMAQYAGIYALIKKAKNPVIITSVLNEAQEHYGVEAKREFCHSFGKNVAHKAYIGDPGNLDSLKQNLEEEDYDFIYLSGIGEEGYRKLVDCIKSLKNKVFLTDISIQGLGNDYNEVSYAGLDCEEHLILFFIKELFNLLSLAVKLNGRRVDGLNNILKTVTYFETADRKHVISFSRMGNGAKFPVCLCKGGKRVDDGDLEKFNDIICSNSIPEFYVNKWSYLINSLENRLLPWSTIVGFKRNYHKFIDSSVREIFDEWSRVLNVNGMSLRILHQNDDIVFGLKEDVCNIDNLLYDFGFFENIQLNLKYPDVGDTDIGRLSVFYAGFDSQDEVDSISFGPIANIVSIEEICKRNGKIGVGLCVKNPYKEDIPISFVTSSNLLNQYKNLLGFVKKCQQDSKVYAYIIRQKIFSRGNGRNALVFFSDKKMSALSLQLIEELFNRVLSSIYNVLYSSLINKSAVRSAIGSIMSRNGSHNIGSHVLAALSHNVGTLPDDRVLYQYIQQRMDYIATVTTDFPTWTQPTMFVADMVKTFLSQRHLLDHIVESEGLKAFQFQNPNMDDDEWLDQENCVRIHVRKKKAKGEYVDIIKYDSKDDRTRILDLENDVALAIPGGIVGEHAFYTILENIIRNAAKHSWAVRGRKKLVKNLDLYIDFEDKDETVSFEVYTKLNEDCGTIVKSLNEKLAEPFIDDKTNALRRENWGLAEMKISAGYLAQSKIEEIGGLEKVDENAIKAYPHNSGRETYLGYQFSIAKPKEILIIVEDKGAWSKNEWQMKKEGVFVKTFEEAKKDLKLNYRYIVHYDATKFFNVKTREPKDGILIPFRMLSGKSVPKQDWSWLQPFVADLDDGKISGTSDGSNNSDWSKKSGFDQLKVAFEKGYVESVRKIVYKAYYEHLKKARKNKEIKDIGLLVAINENEKAGGNSLISDADILELMMEQNFASCVDQYKALMPVDACKKILRPLEIIRNCNSNKCVKFKDRKGATIKQLIAQRLYDWMNQEKKYKDASGKDVPCSVISKNPEIGNHLKEKYSVSRQNGEAEKPLTFDDPVSALLKQHPIDDFIRYVESVFENTKTLFKQYEEKIVTLPAGYKVQASDVKDGEKFVDGIKIVTSAKETKGDSCHWIGYRRHSHTLPVDATQSLYVEPLSGTQTYLSQLSKVKSDLGLQMRLIENGLMRILVLDERVAKFLREHMAEVGDHYKAMNINVIDDKWVEAGDPDVAKASGFFTGYTKDVSAKLENYANATPEQRSKVEEELGNIKRDHFNDIDILIVHQGILDKWFEKLKSVEGMKHLLEGFKQLVKYVVVTTGRGTPENIPEEAHLLPFAVVESTLFKKYPEKLILTDTIMNVLPVGKKNNGG